MVVLLGKVVEESAREGGMARAKDALCTLARWLGLLPSSRPSRDKRVAGRGRGTSAEGWSAEVEEFSAEGVEASCEPWECSPNRNFPARSRSSHHRRMDSV